MDLLVYQHGGDAVLAHRSPYATDEPATGYPFTYPPFAAVVPEPLHDPARNIFDAMREGDILVHHPFESFPATVERFLETAAEDDQVLAIKLTLYRTSGDTAIVQALSEAAQRGKQVAVLVELKARFDEVNNIQWARKLESFGVHVAYGSAELKTHTKTALVVRREPDGIRRYVHIGSGNYNSKTAKLYTDVGLLTCDPVLAADVSDVFNSLTGFSRQRDYDRLLVAPGSLRSGVLALIEREAGHARAGRPARIIAKMNALVDPEVIAGLYSASQAGVQIELIVRGVCCLVPGVKGLSENIHVRSIVDRFYDLMDTAPEAATVRALHARSLLVLTFPREAWWVRAGVRTMNVALSVWRALAGGAERPNA